MKARSTLAIAAIALAIAAVIILSPSAQTPPPGPRLTVVSPGSTRYVATVSRNGHDMVALDELAGLLGLALQEDAMTGGLTVSYKTKNITLTSGWALASVQGKLISLPAPITKEGSAWFVPVEFINRAAALILDTKIDLRTASRLLIVGDLRIPRVVARHTQGDPERVTLQVSQKVAYNVRQEGAKLVVRLEADAVDLAVAAPPGGQTIAAIRTGEGASVVIETGPQFAAFRAGELPSEASALLVEIELTSTAAAETKPAPGTPGEKPVVPPPDAPAPPLPDLAPAAAIRTIVIDPGHGGDEQGAHGPGGALEKTVTLQVARRLKAAIEARLGLRVLLTRDGDQTVRLDERAALANNNKADLFVSLHANASVRPAVAGAEVFTLNLDEYGPEGQQIAAGDPAELPVLGGGTRPLELIRWDMAQARHAKDSGSWATFVLDELRNRVPVSARPIIRAPFRVLVGANMPAVLVEMGFITNPEQEKQLTSDAFQNNLVAALVQSIVRFGDFLQSGRADAPVGNPPASWNP